MRSIFPLRAFTFLKIETVSSKPDNHLKLSVFSQVFLSAEFACVVSENPTVLFASRQLLSQSVLRHNPERNRNNRFFIAILFPSPAHAPGPSTCWWTPSTWSTQRPSSSPSSYSSLRPTTPVWPLEIAQKEPKCDNGGPKISGIRTIFAFSDLPSFCDSPHLHLTQSICVF